MQHYKAYVYLAVKIVLTRTLFGMFSTRLLIIKLEINMFYTNKL